MRGELIGRLGLDRPVDRGQHLTLADPASGVDVNRADEAAFTSHADRLIAPCGQRPGCSDGPRNVGPARNNYRDRRNLTAALAGGAGRLALPACILRLASEHGEGQGQGKRDKHRTDDQPPPLVAAINHDQRVRPFKTRFPVHSCHSFALPRTCERGPATVLREQLTACNKDIDPHRANPFSTNGAIPSASRCRSTNSRPC